MDINLINIITAFSLIIIGYLFGSIPNAIWIGKVFFHKDPRDYGSGNAGGTNAGRVFGKPIGLLVIFLDAIKVILPLYLSWYILVKTDIYQGGPLVKSVENIYLNTSSTAVINWPIYWLTTIGCSIGHCLPIFANFKGGKNVSTFYGIAIGTSWAFGIIPGIIFLIILKVKKYVSLSSIVSSWFSVLLAWIWAILIATKTISGSTVWIINYGPSLECNYVFAICLTFAAVFLTYFHKDNIKRLYNKTERKITWMK